MYRYVLFLIIRRHVFKWFPDALLLVHRSWTLPQSLLCLHWGGHLENSIYTSAITHFCTIKAHIIISNSKSFSANITLQRGVIWKPNLVWFQIFPCALSQISNHTSPQGDVCTISGLTLTPLDLLWSLSIVWSCFFINWYVEDLFLRPFGLKADPIAFRKLSGVIPFTLRQNDLYKH